MKQAAPHYLQATLTEKPLMRAANLAWLRHARYGMFVHYGLYSLLGHGEWVQYNEKIPVYSYAMLQQEFTAEHFDAEKIVAFARQCGMKYITFTTRHHDGFCLWDSKVSAFNSMNSPAHRDLVREMLAACEKQDMALFLYYSHGRDWRHPHGPDNETWGGKARPEYDPPDPSYAYGALHHLEKYNDFVLAQVTELIEQYPMAAGIWFDGIGVPLSGDPSAFNLPRLYSKIRELSPHMLISYKQGVTGTEDYFAPEHKIPAPNEAMGALANRSNGKRLMEVCTTMLEHPGSWGYHKLSFHRPWQSVVQAMQSTIGQGANLLLNSGPLPDGSVDETDRAILMKALAYYNSIHPQQEDKL